jgi:hypothetical protein
MCVPLSESLYVPDGGDLYHTIKHDAGGAELGVGRCAFVRAPLSESLYVPDGGDLYHTINSLVIADPLV